MGSLTVTWPWCIVIDRPTILCRLCPVHCERIDIGHHGTIIPGYVLSKYVLHGNSSLLFIIDIISYLLAGIQFNSRIPSILTITIDIDMVDHR